MNAVARRPLEEVATIERDGIAATEIRRGTLYVGLEHIDSDGAFVDVKPVDAGELASNKFRFGPDHILFGKLRPYLRKTARPHFEGICSTDIVPVRPGPELDRDYLFHFLRHPKVVEQAVLRCAGANLPRLSPRDLATFEVPVPPLAEQRRIADILDKADAIRRKRKEAIALTEEVLRSAFLEMFGDPVTNPKGWPVKALGDLLATDPRIGTLVPASEHPGTLVVRVGELGAYDVELSRSKRAALSDAEFERFGVETGDVLLARAIGSEDHLGKASVLQPHDQPVAFDSHVMRLRFRNEFLDPYVFVQWLRTPGGRARFMNEAGRTAVQFNVNGKQIVKVQIPLPPRAEQLRFRQLFDSARDMACRSVAAFGETDTLFNSLVARAFSGALESSR